MIDVFATAAASLLAATAVLVAMPARPAAVVTRGPHLRPRTHPGRQVGHSIPAAVLADLLVAVLDAGLPAGQALEMVLGHLTEAGLVEPPGMASVREALELAGRTGLAPGSLVRAAAAEQRRREAAARTRAARRMGVLIVLPVGLCLLPAFVLLTVVPLVLALL